MYSINSLMGGTSSTSSGTSSKAIGGLASGLDTAELIKGMTTATRLKIARQKQSKQLVSWQTDAYRNISNKLIDFSKKYTSYTSSTNLLSSSFYTKTSITTLGDNADKVSVSGSSDMAENISIISASKASAGGALSSSELKIADVHATASNTLSELGISSFDLTITNTVGDTTINGLSASSTIDDVVNAINTESATTGISARYVESLGRFEFTTTKDTPVNITGGLATSLFGDDVSVAKKKDAEIEIKYGDTGSTITLTSSTGKFNVDGLNITINDSFVSGSGNVTLSAKTDTDKVLSTIKDMVKDYNDIVTVVNKEYSTKPNRNYPPLTDEQRKEMSESEIKAWEDKAKSGMLFGNSDMSSLSNDLRNVFFSSGENMVALNAIGITSSSDWKDNGKIIIDEEKLKKAIEDNPDNVKALLSDKLENKKDEFGNDILVDGLPVQDPASGGAVSRLKFLTDKYAKTDGATKGILVEKAGNEASPLSLTKNILLDKMNSFDNIIKSLTRTLAKEEKRYQKQFTALETAVSKLNAQSGWLQQF